MMMMMMMMMMTSLPTIEAVFKADQEGLMVDAQLIVEPPVRYTTFTLWSFTTNHKENRKTITTPQRLVDEIPLSFAE